MEKKQFIESVRSSFADKGYNEEQMKGIETLADAMFETLRTETNAVRVEAERKANEIIEAKLGDLGNGQTMAQTITGLQDSIRALSAGEAKQKTFWDALRAAYTENEEAIKATRTSGSHKFSFRAAAVITMANIDADSMLGTRDTVVDAAARLPEFLPSTLINEQALGAGSNPHRWMERKIKEGAAAYVTEGNAKPFMDFEWEENEVTAKTIAAIVPISRVATWNYPTLEAEVRGELLDELRDKYNNAIINGAGTAEINGLKAVYATEFATAGLVVENANMWDALILAWKQSRKKVRGQRPSAILMSIDKVIELDLQKDKNGQYLLPTWITNANKGLKGTPIIECEYLGEKEVLIGDFTKANFNFVQDVAIEVGWINDDFQKNRYALRAEFFGMQYVKTHKNNFVKITDIDAAVATLQSQGAGA